MRACRNRCLELDWLPQVISMLLLSFINFVKKSTTSDCRIARLAHDFGLDLLTSH